MKLGKCCIRTINVHGTRAHELTCNDGRGGRGCGRTLEFVPGRWDRAKWREGHWRHARAAEKSAQVEPKP